MSRTIFHFVAQRLNDQLKVVGIASGVIEPRSWPGAPDFYDKLQKDICAQAGWPADNSFLLHTLNPIHVITGQE